MDNATVKRIKFLAYLHSYALIPVLLLSWLVFREHGFYAIASGFIAFALWSFLGYKLKWKHIFCSYQKTYHEKMTPERINWKKIKKADAYGIPLVFALLGLLTLSIAILRSLGCL